MAFHIVSCKRARRYYVMMASIALALTHFSSGNTLASGTITNCAEIDLRLALLGGGVVTLSCDNIITVNSSIVVAKEVLLDGTGHPTGLSGNGGTNSAPIFVVQRGATLTLRNLSVSNGQLLGTNGLNGQAGLPALGAAIYIDGGIVVLDGCTFSGNLTTGGDGAASLGVKRGGDGGQGAGGAIYNAGGQLFVTNSVFIGNSSIGGAAGSGTPERPGGNGVDGTDGGNGGNGSGAAIYNGGGGSCIIDSSTFSSNSVTGALAGVGGAPSGTLAFPGKNGHSGSGLGAAIFNENGILTIVNSTFLANSAMGSTGADGADGTVTLEGIAGSIGGNAQGGGIYNGGGTASITNCTFVANSLSGGLGGSGGAGEADGLGSDGGDGGSGGDALGAGVCTATGASTILVNCTFADNRATGGPGGIGGPGTGIGDTGSNGNTGNQAGGAIFNQGGTIHLKNTILAFTGNSSNAGGAVLDEGYNLSTDSNPALKAQGSRNNIDPKLGSFIKAGGTVATLTLASNSPAINAIMDLGGNGGPAFDQRKAIRIEPFDIGAYEFDGVFGMGQLQVQLRAGQIVLSWPAAGGYSLQTAIDLSAATPWLPVNSQGTVSGTHRELALPTTSETAYFRLMQQ